LEQTLELEVDVLKIGGSCEYCIHGTVECGYCRIHAIIAITTKLYDLPYNKKKKMHGLSQLFFKKHPVSHPCLFKLNYYGIRAKAYNLMNGYLTNRKQFVNYSERTASSMKPVNIGVPQGSILGHMLYVLYVNDFQQAVDCIPRVFTNDTFLVIQGKTVKQLQHSLNLEMTKVEQWMSANRLTINPQKSAILCIYHLVKIF